MDITIILIECTHTVNVNYISSNWVTISLIILIIHGMLLTLHNTNNTKIYYDWVIYTVNPTTINNTIN